jgi:hypothetical protein
VILRGGGGHSRMHASPHARAVSRHATSRASPHVGSEGQAQAGLHN